MQSINERRPLKITLHQKEQVEEKCEPLCPSWPGGRGNGNKLRVRLALCYSSRASI